MPFPITTILDDFNRTPGTALGTNWTRWHQDAVTGTMEISAGGGALTVTAGSWNYWNVTTFGPDCGAFVTWQEALANVDGQYLVFGLRLGGVLSGPDYTGYSVLFLPSIGGSNVGLGVYRQGTGGGVELLNTTSAGNHASGDVYGATIVGTTISCYRNGTVVGSTADAGPAHTGAGYIGFGGSSVSQDFDDFGGGTISGAPSTTALDHDGMLFQYTQTTRRITL